MDAAKTIEGSIGPRGQTSAFAERKNSVEPFDDERGMSSFCGMELRFDTEVQIYGPSRKPDAVASGHLRGLLDFAKPEDSGVKLPSPIFAADRNRQLHVVKAKDWHRLQGLAWGRLRPRERHKNSYREGLKRETSSRQELATLLGGTLLHSSVEFPKH
jgi:hypothetical protein